MKDCVFCKGHGKVLLEYDDEFMTCPNCKGKGSIVEETVKIEQEVIKMTADIWNKFIGLEQTHPSDINDLADAIHDIQKIIAIRTVRRSEPNTYVTYKSN